MKDDNPEFRERVEVYLYHFLAGETAGLSMGLIIFLLVCAGLACYWFFPAY